MLVYFVVLFHSFFLPSCLQNPTSPCMLIRHKLPHCLATTLEICSVLMIVIIKTVMIIIVVTIVVKRLDSWPTLLNFHVGLYIFLNYTLFRYCPIIPGRTFELFEFYQQNKQFLLYFKCLCMIFFFNATIFCYP